MFRKNKILAIIPCRSGSKGIKNKNILKVFDKHLVYYSIEFAKNCKFIDRVLLSTDSKKYAKISKSYGLDVPFLRPKKISKDSSLDIEFVKHALLYLSKSENYRPDIIIILRPTSPLRKLKVMRKALNLLINTKTANSVKSISKMDKSLYKTWSMDHKNNKLTPVISNKTKYKEPYNAPRQKLGINYYQNAVYDLFYTDNIKQNLISGKSILGIETEDAVDIDNFADISKLRKLKKNFANFKNYINS